MRSWIDLTIKGGRMLRWVLKEHDQISIFKHYSVNEAVIHAQLSQEHLDCPFWFCISDQAFRAFITRNCIRPEDIQRENLEPLKKELQKAALPQDLVNEIRRTLNEEGLSKAKFQVRLSCDVKRMTSQSFSQKWLKDYCEMSALNGEGVLQAIKGCWISILDPAFMTRLWEEELTLADLKVGLIITIHQDIKEYGKVYSVSPHCLWDRRNLVVTLRKSNLKLELATQNEKPKQEQPQQEQQQHSYLVDKESLTVTYYGKNMDAESMMTQEKIKTKVADPMAFDLVKKVAKHFLAAEQTLNEPLIGEWISNEEGFIHFKKWDFYHQAPHSGYYQSHLNNQARHFWQILNWREENQLCLPYWFSLLVRQFRPLTVQYLQKLGMRKYLTSDYEKVLRHAIGILRGRPYLNLGAIQRLLLLNPFTDSAHEISHQLGQWQRKYDKEIRVFWEGPWPESPQVSQKDLKTAKKNLRQLRSQWHQKKDDILLNLERDIQFLYDFKWEQKNLSETLNEIRKLETKILDWMLPVFGNEIEFWTRKSTLNQSQITAGTFSWLLPLQNFKIEADGGWWARRRAKKNQEGWEKVCEIRFQYERLMVKFFKLFQRRLENVGSKMVSLGLIRHAQEIFYLTHEELSSFEEGRLTTVNLKALVDLRQQEYRHYRSDGRVPQIWLTMGLVGLAEQYPSIVPIRYLNTNDTASDVSMKVQPEVYTNLVNKIQNENPSQIETTFDLEANTQEAIANMKTDSVSKTMDTKDSQNSPDQALPKDISEEFLEMPSDENFILGMISPLSPPPIFIDELQDKYEVLESEDFEIQKISSQTHLPKNRMTSAEHE